MDKGAGLTTSRSAEGVGRRAAGDEVGSASPGDNSASRILVRNGKPLEPALLRRDMLKVARGPQGMMGSCSWEKRRGEIFPWALFGTFYILCYVNVLPIQTNTHNSRIQKNFKPKGEKHLVKAKPHWRMGTKFRL